MKANFKKNWTASEGQGMDDWFSAACRAYDRMYASGSWQFADTDFSRALRAVADRDQAYEEWRRVGPGASYQSWMEFMVENAPRRPCSVCECEDILVEGKCRVCEQACP